MKDEGETKADGDGGSLRGGVAQEQAARLPRAHPLASLQTAAAADIAYTNACSLVPLIKKIQKSMFLLAGELVGLYATKGGSKRRPM